MSVHSSHKNKPTHHQEPSMLQNVKTKMNYVQLIILIISTLLLTLLIDVAIDNFLLLGISQLIQIKKKKEEDAKRARPQAKKCHIFAVICKIRKKVDQTKDHYMNLLPNVDTITGYGMAILCILAGTLMLFYFLFILTKIWNLWSSSRNMLDVILDYKTYVVLVLTIVFNFGIIAVLFVFNENSQKTYENVNINLLDVERNYLRLTANVKYDTNYSNVMRSMTQIRMYFFLNNVRLMTAMVSLFLLSGFTSAYLIINICF